MTKPSQPIGAAIDIDPKAEDAYLGLAEAYVENGDLRAAVDILKEGLEKTESVAMEERLAELERQLAEQKAQEQAKLVTRLRHRKRWGKVSSGSE